MNDALAVSQIVLQNEGAAVLSASIAYNGIAIAASAGGLEALTRILSALPVDFPAVILIVMHVMPNRDSHLATLLGARCALSVYQANEGDHLQAGSVFVAPPNFHLLVKPDGTLTLSSAAKVHFTRPAADPLFESVASYFRQNAIGVVLTGGDGDGSDGIRAIKRLGGVTIAQDEATSEHFSMPRSAIETGDVDFVLPITEIARVLLKLVDHTAAADQR